MTLKTFKNFFYNNVTEMRHFILGALTVVVLVITVPFAADMQKNSTNTVADSLTSSISATNASTKTTPSKSKKITPKMRRAAQDPVIKFDLSNIPENQDVGVYVFKTLIDGLKSKNYTGTNAKTASKRVQAAFEENIDGMCGLIEDFDNSDSCYLLYEETYQSQIARAKSSKDIVKALESYRTKYYVLAGIK